MASHSNVSSSRRKSRKAHFAAPSHIRRKIMSVHLAKDLRDKHHVRQLPVHKDDEVRIKRGNFKNKVGKVLTVYRKKWCIHVEKIQKEKPNGQTVQIPINTSNCELTNIKMTEFRKKLIQRKVEGQKKGKGLAPDID